ncbi:Ion-translocating oxidoreductase complex subunit G [subsurface metagenome]
MKKILISGGKLFSICAVAALTLGVINAITEPVIEHRKIIELERALLELAPDAETGAVSVPDENLNVRAVYPLAKGGKEAGYILELFGIGYSGDMKILARFAADGSIASVKLMDNLETPGLGKKAEDPAYMRKFLGTGGSARPVPVRKDMLTGAQADAITGATITFLGISKALAKGSRYIREGEIENVP